MGEKVNGRSNPDIMDSHCGAPSLGMGIVLWRGSLIHCFLGLLVAARPFFPWSYLKQLSQPASYLEKIGSPGVILSHLDGFSSAHSFFGCVINLFCFSV